ncbi:alpha-mannosyltransferase [Coniochaeta ligniaria NRRL 30616]|uniref:Alpha-mannosyltransferase n=1 Tax=Coniochaeta ligniaria NRRL 30616 TaxID=1408157 RepID=A0A1J7JHA9_9PEZI|nr:alpha-mannosyltransferase [Coniochaeta ligniaria NRRL 30616]
MCIMRKKLLIVGQIICLAFISTSLYFGREKLTRLRVPSFVAGSSNTGSAQGAKGDTAPSTVVLSPANITSYLNAILDPQATHSPRLSCPQLDTARYDYLKAAQSEPSTIQYFFALNLRQCLGVLPRLIGSVVEVIKFLGPEQCALSIIEGPSTDGTGEVLAALRPGLDALTTTYYFKSSNITTREGDRIARLAELRNMALLPLLDEQKRYGSNTTVIFLNDVAACHEDILELVHQRQFLGADMTCAMDWTYAGSDPTFYDVWIARGMNGDSFFEIPPEGNWDLAWNLFWNNPEAQSRSSAHQPFQVFSCWNGAVAFTAKPVVEKTIGFRAPNKELGECHQGEPQLFCKDLWFHGYGKIATVPAVNLEYTDEQARKIKEAKGYTSQWVSGPGHVDEAINWQLEPPERVKCMPNWQNQFWQAWNETLT